MEHVSTAKPKYLLNDFGEFIINEYNNSKPFSSFFPGIAGLHGVPMWVFYVNRGQCISGMGVQDKDHPIMEFLPANRAYDLVTSQGFRTFIKLTDSPAIEFYEPFQNNYRDRHHLRTQRMIIAPSHITIEEENYSLNLKFSVEYYTVPQDSYSGMIRTLRIENQSSQNVKLNGLDGLPIIVPYGVDNFCLKNMRRTIEAFVEVKNMENKVPYFKGKVEADDRPDVLKITKGNFYLGFEVASSNPILIDAVVDPIRIFGNRKDYSYPENFLTLTKEEILKDQKVENQLPCAFSIFNASIPAGECYKLTSIIGHTSSLTELNKFIPRIIEKEYVTEKANTNKKIIELLTQNNFINSSEPSLDHYARQNFLDNIMRGGFPITLEGNKDITTLYLYARKHGDMERDYNDFRLMPTPYSQGNGNFRDINQNRRSDLFFNPDMRGENIEYFYNLIQLDGFNPLILKEIKFSVENSNEVKSLLEKYIVLEDIERVTAFLRESFTPGSLLTFFNENAVSVRKDIEIFIGELLNHCRRMYETEHGEGFWTDHWTYNLDLLENYLAVFPDMFMQLLFKHKNYTFYDNPYYVAPRDEKYVLWEGKAMQLGSVLLNNEKAKLIQNRQKNPNQMRMAFGSGDVYYTSLFNKLLCLIINKIASLDPEGVGVEMEAGKPGWYDALNGLPGLFGSSVSETLEIKRHILFLQDIFREYRVEDININLHEELYEFMMKTDDLLSRNLTPFEYWDLVTDAKESYRQKTLFGISGKEIKIHLRDISRFFKNALVKLNSGIDKAQDKSSKIIFTYFRHEVTDYAVVEKVNADGQKTQTTNVHGQVCIKPIQFKQIPLPLFLEGPVHYLRCKPKFNEAKGFAKSVKNSDLYDIKLMMYKVNASLRNESLEIGRARVFSPGWLENESIWLHMEYKYILELLRNNLFDEFYTEFKNVCVPFLDPEMYGRSILENSSFLVSSVHPDSSIHGNGFVARLSGATAEFIHILLLMIVGERPFRLNSQGELQLCLNPSLPKSLFTRKPELINLYIDNNLQEIEVSANTFSFMFLGKILVTYHNNDLKDTFGPNNVKPVEWEIEDCNGNRHTCKAGTLQGEIVEQIRNRKVIKIDIFLE